MSLSTTTTRESIMSSRDFTVRKLTFTGIAILAVIGPVATPAAEAEAAEQLTWLRASSCTRVERSIGYADVDGECLRDHPAFGDDVTVCAGHFCAAEPGEPGARIIHPTDFGPTS